MLLEDAASDPSRMTSGSWILGSCPSQRPCRLANVVPVQTSGSTVNIQCYCDVCSCMHGQVVQHTLPMVLLMLQGSKHAEQCSVEPFGHTISHWMVDGCPGLFNSGHVTKLLDDFSLKIRYWLEHSRLGNP